MTPKQLANLKPAGPGNNLNPAGRKGKTGDKGMSLKQILKKQFEQFPPEAWEAIARGLVFKAQEADVKVLEYMHKIMDDPLENKSEAEESNGPQIIINMPKKDEESC